MVKISTFILVILLTNCSYRHACRVTYDNGIKQTNNYKKHVSRNLYTIEKGIKLFTDSVTGKIVEKTIYKYKTSCKGAIKHFDLMKEKTITYDKFGHITSRHKKRQTN